DHPHLICYAVKANSNLAVLSALAKLGSGFDIVSGGEFARVLAAGGTPEKVVFSGVGKTHSEITQALKAGIRCFNVESAAELDRLSAIAKAEQTIAPISLRINPDVDAQTHPYISTGLKENKFGISVEDAKQLYPRAAADQWLDVQGVDCHIGSQLTSVEPYVDALNRLLELVDDLNAQGISLSHIDVGGGQGICYQDETPLDIQDWAKRVLAALGERNLEVLVEPGRAVVGPAGVLLTRVEYLKSNEEKHFAVVDAAMNDLIRPSLYSAWQAIEPVETNERPAQDYDVVGPVCESADFLGKDRALAIAEGDYLAVRSSGAYAFVMSSNYNTRGRAAELLVFGDTVHVARERESVESLFVNEHPLP
nr:diaminopimelate decarboxylase [Gammaproteobacteria bacterium]